LHKKRGNESLFRKEKGSSYEKKEEVADVVLGRVQAGRERCSLGRGGKGGICWGSEHLFLESVPLISIRKALVTCGGVDEGGGKKGEAPRSYADHKGESQ